MHYEACHISNLDFLLLMAFILYEIGRFDEPLNI